MSEFNPGRIGVVGAGTMGSGIALAALYAGFEVVLQDPYPEALSRANDYLEKFLARKDMSDRMSQVLLTGALDDLHDCSFVVEAALEDLALKSELFRDLDAICAAAAVLGTNTSTLSVTRIAAETIHPERVVGIHFFNPAPVLPLVEVIRGAHTAPETVHQALAFVRALGKTPVQVADTPGFIVNRVARPFYGEALRLLGEGTADHAGLDLALRLGAGFKMGPFELMDLIGVDINATAMQSMYEQTFGEPRYRPHPLQVRKMNSGDLGRKSGRGFYNYHLEETGIRKDEPPEMGGGSGQVLYYSGRWSCGVDAVLREAGYETVAFPTEDEPLEAVFITEAHSEALRTELERVDWLLPEEVPVFVQCLDSTLEAHLPPGRDQPRFIGLDTLFLSGGRLATLTAPAGTSAAVRKTAEEMMRSLGRLPFWVEDTPGMVLPRVVGMLINEAAFAVQDQVAEPEMIDQAMQLGVSYPKGLIAWGEELGWPRVLALLEHLHHEYGEDRYRPCQLVRRWARRTLREENTGTPVAEDSWRG